MPFPFFPKNIHPLMVPGIEDRELERTMRTWVQEFAKLKKLLSDCETQMDKFFDVNFEISREAVQKKRDRATPPDMRERLDALIDKCAKLADVYNRSAN